MEKLRHVVDPTTKKWYAIDEDNHVWVFNEDMSVGLDITLTPELKEEGLAGELRRTVQEYRKQRDLSHHQFLDEDVVVGPQFAGVLAKHGPVIAEFCKVRSIKL